MANSMSVQETEQAAAEQIVDLKAGAQQFYDAIVTATANNSYEFPVIDLATEPVDGANIIGRVDTIQAPSDFFFGGFGVPVPATPTLDTITIPNFGPVPEFTLSSPVVTIPVPPDATLPGAPTNTPTFNAPAIPNAPTLSLPAVPVFENIAIPPVPTYTIPTYSVVFPDDDLLAPSFTFSYSEQEFQDDLLDDLKVKLMNDLLNGGYGIEPLDEQPLWERAREREMLAANTLIEQAAASAAARGFMAPPGALLALIEGAQQAALEKISSANRDIALKRADMYVENRKFTITEVRQVENMLITLFSTVQERALNAAKYVAEFSKHAYDALVARYQARVAGAQAASQAYEVQLRAGLASLEAYKVQMEGAQLTVEVQKLVADVYRVQLDGVMAFISIYKAQMEGAHIAAEIENLKLTAFRSSVEAYSAQVSAKSAEFGMYKARLEGEMSKVEVFKAQVTAFEGQVSAYSTGATAKRTILDSQIQSAKLEIDIFNSEITAFSQQLAAAKMQLDTLLTKHQADTQRYSSKVHAQQAVSEATANVSRANADIALAKAKQQADYSVATASELTSRAHLSSGLAAGMYGSYAAQITALGNRIAGILAEINSSE